MGTKLLMILAFSAMTSLSPVPSSPKMKSIFNGKNLKGWVAPEDNIWWKVENGILQARSGVAKQGSILWTQKSYENFVVELDFRMGEGTVDSGIFMRSDEKPQPQIQIGISGSLKRDMTGSPYVPGGGYPVEAEGVADLLKVKDWNTLRAQAIGNDYTVWLNGVEVMNYTVTDDNPVLVGPIGLQLHPGRDMEIDFRNIRVGKL